MVDPSRGTGASEAGRGPSSRSGPSSATALRIKSVRRGHSKGKELINDENGLRSQKLVLIKRSSSISNIKQDHELVDPAGQKCSRHRASSVDYILRPIESIASNGVPLPTKTKTKLPVTHRQPVILSPKNLDSSAIHTHEQKKSAALVDSTNSHDTLSHVVSTTASTDDLSQLHSEPPIINDCTSLSVTISKDRRIDTESPVIGGSRSDVSRSLSDSVQAVMVPLIQSKLNHSKFHSPSRSSSKNVPSLITPEVNNTSLKSPRQLGSQENAQTKVPLTYEKKVKADVALTHHIISTPQSKDKSASTSTGRSSLESDSIRPPMRKKDEKPLEIRLDPVTKDIQLCELPLRDETLSWRPLVKLSRSRGMASQVLVCRTPTELHEPVANLQFQVPFLVEVTNRCKDLEANGKNWIIWELSSRRESISSHLASSFHNQILPYRISETGIMTLDFIRKFISSVLFWLNLDADNIAIMMFYEDEAAYQCLLVCLLLFLDYYDVSKMLSHNDVQAKGTSKGHILLTIPSIESVLSKIRPDLFKKNFTDFARSPTVLNWATVDPFMVGPSEWPRNKRCYLNQFVSMLEDQTDESGVKPIKTYHLKSVSVENFVGKLNTASIEFYHVSDIMMTDGRPCSAKDIKHDPFDKHTHRPNKTGGNGRPQCSICYQVLSELSKYHTPRRGSMNMLHSHKGGRKTSLAESSNEGDDDSSLKQDHYLTWIGLKKTQHLMREPSVKGDFLFATHGGLKNHSKFKPTWEDCSTVFQPTTSCRYSTLISSRETPYSYSATYNFTVAQPSSGSKQRSDKRDRLKSQDSLDSFVEPVALGGDILVVIRQEPLTYEVVRGWETGRSRESAVASKSDTRSRSLVGIFTFHTSFIEEEVITVKSKDFEYYSLEDSRLVKWSEMKGSQSFQMNILVNEDSVGRKNSRPKPFDTTGTFTASDSEGTVGHTSDRRVQDILRTNCNTSSPDSSPMRRVPALDLDRVHKISTDPTVVMASTRRKKNIFGAIFNSKRGTGRDMSPSSNNAHESLITSRGLKQWMHKPKTARLMKSDEFGTAPKEFTVLPARWWQEVIHWRSQWCGLVMKPFPDIDEFCRRHIVKADRNQMQWRDDAGYQDIECVCAMKVCDNTISALGFAQKYFAVDLDESSPDFAPADDRRFGVPTSRTHSKPQRVASGYDANHRAASMKGNWAKGILKRLNMDLFVKPSKPEDKQVVKRKRKPAEDCQGFTRPEYSMSQHDDLLDIRTLDDSEQSGDWPLLTLERTSHAAMTTNTEKLIRRRHDIRHNSVGYPGESKHSASLPPNVAQSYRHVTPFVKPLEVKFQDEEPQSPLSCRSASPSRIFNQALEGVPHQRWKSVDYSASIAAAEASSIDKAGINRVNKTQEITMSQISVAPERCRRLSITKPSVVNIERVTMPATVSMSATTKHGDFSPANHTEEEMPPPPAVVRASVDPPKKKAPPPKKKAPPVAGGGGVAGLFSKKAAALGASKGGAPVGKAPLGRRLFWKPLGGDLKDTVFAEIDPATEDVVDFDANTQIMSKVFIKEAKKTSASAKKGEGAMNGTKSAQLHTVIDPKRAQNMAIVVLRFKISMEDCVNTLLTLKKDSRLTTDDLTKFECLILTPDEETELEHFLSHSDPAGLREVPERKILPLRAANVSRAKARSDILLFTDRWKNSVSSLTESLVILETASQEMRDSKCIRQFLSVVLRWGNFVNYGALKELQIKAITLSSLLKLADFKTNIDSSITSLHYIVANIIAAAPELELHNMTKDMSTVKLAAKISGDSLEQTWKQLRGGYELLVRESSKFESDYQPSDIHPDRGIKLLLAYKAEVEKEIENLETRICDVMSIVLSTAKFFGDDDAQDPTHRSHDGARASLSLGSFFVTFRQFLTKFEEAIADVIKRPQAYLALVPEEHAEALIEFSKQMKGSPTRGPQQAAAARTIAATKASPSKKTVEKAPSPIPTIPPQKISAAPQADEAKRFECRTTSPSRISFSADSSPVERITPKTPPVRLRKSEASLSKSSGRYRNCMAKTPQTAAVLEAGPAISNMYVLKS